MIQSNNFTSVSIASVADAVLSAFLFHGCYDSDNDEFTFILNEEYFSTKLQKEVAREINKYTKEKDFNYTYLATLLEDKYLRSGAGVAIEFMEIFGQTPMDLKLAKKYHDGILLDNYNFKLINGGF